MYKTAIDGYKREYIRRYNKKDMRVLCAGRCECQDDNRGSIRHRKSHLSLYYCFPGAGIGFKSCAGGRGGNKYRRYGFR